MRQLTTPAATFNVAVAESPSYSAVIVTCFSVFVLLRPVAVPLLIVAAFVSLLDHSTRLVTSVSIPLSCKIQVNDVVPRLDIEAVAGTISMYRTDGLACCETLTTILNLSSSVFAVKEPDRSLYAWFSAAVMVIVYFPLLLLKLLTVSHDKLFVMTHGFLAYSSKVSLLPPATNGETITVSPCAFLVPP